jgi:hypothetical protein
VINKLFLRSIVGRTSVKRSKSYYDYQPQLGYSTCVTYSHMVTRSVALHTPSTFDQLMSMLCGRRKVDEEASPPPSRRHYYDRGEDADGDSLGLGVFGVPSSGDSHASSQSARRSSPWDPEGDLVGDLLGPPRPPPRPLPRPPPPTETDEEWNERMNVEANPYEDCPENEPWGY